MKVVKTELEIKKEEGIKKEKLSNKNQSFQIIEQKENFILAEEKNITSKILIKNILYLSYKDSVVSIHFVNNRDEINLSRTLISFEQELSVYGFIRVSRKHMIDISKVICINRKKYEVTMLNNENLTVSRRKMTELRLLLANFKNRLSVNTYHSSG